MPTCLLAHSHRDVHRANHRASCSAPVVEGTVAEPVRPPVPMVLCDSARLVPSGAGWGYEPKFDGFRAMLFTDPDGQGPQLWSRNGNELTNWFPEEIDQVAGIGPGAVVDAELVMFTAGHTDFTGLQRRMAQSPKHATRLAEEHPTQLVAFDLLATKQGGDLRARPYLERRRLLADLLADQAGDRARDRSRSVQPVQLVPMTTDRDEALGWMEAWAAQGIEGLVAKRLDQPYLGGKRAWTKIRRREPHDVIVGGVQGPVTSPTHLLIGLLDESGVLRPAGMTRPVPPRDRAHLGSLLTPYVAADGSTAGGTAEEHPWPSAMPASRAGGLAGRMAPIQYTRVHPTLVVEVEVDSPFEHGKWRHSVIYRRARPDLTATDITGPLA